MDDCGKRACNETIEYQIESGDSVSRSLGMDQMITVRVRGVGVGNQ
jgi:hypothetical protein